MSLCVLGPEVALLGRTSLKQKSPFPRIADSYHSVLLTEHNPPRNHLTAYKSGPVYKEHGNTQEASPFKKAQTNLSFVGATLIAGAFQNPCSPTRKASAAPCLLWGHTLNCTHMQAGNSQETLGEGKEKKRQL